jgi:DEAD/DEAH box helicase domain-containing protein
MSDIGSQLIRELNLDVIETIDLPPREERRLSVPSSIQQGPLGSRISELLPDGSAWRHQALALEMLENRQNVLVGTGTASGKSLIFQLYAFHKLQTDPQARVLIFYPLKALASDQYSRWQSMAEKLGIDPAAVVRIDGEVPTVDRGELLERGRVVLMTPDVCQAWLMRNVGNSFIRRFFERLALLVLDEAHVYESVFGSNVAFLLRRMLVAKKRSTQSSSDGRRLQIIAATATIYDPADHLERLTGLKFSVVGEDENGAPGYARQIIHVNGAEYGAAGEAALVDLVRGIEKLENRNRFIAFMDSRQGVERIVRDVGRTGVLPYRSGYEAQDRKKIEAALRSGALDGVITTSALELGIDIADMTIGANLGVPQSRKAFRQRIGRVGRSCPGLFFVIAGPNAFKRFGQTFREYFDGSVEPSYLYLGNRFVQFAHARCLADEVEVLGGDQTTPPSGAAWPNGFETICKYARPGGGRPREFDFIAQLGSDSPHHNYPLRQIGEASFDINNGRGAGPHSRLGSIATNQAIREAYPGATYLHMGEAYKVNEWSTRAFERAIKVSPAREPATTRPLLRKSVTLSLSPADIVDGRILQCGTGIVAEVHLQVNESVEGYSIGRNKFLYRELRAENPNMSRKQRDFRTTGILIRIEEPWFSGGHQQAALVREQVARGLLGLLSRERSIASQDVDATHTNIALLTETGPKRLTDAIVIYDSVYGGLRLSEDLFVDFSHYVDQMARAASLAGSDAIAPPDVANNLRKWSDTLTSTNEPQINVGQNPHDGWFQIYKPGSIVSILFNGNFVERELIAPKLVDIMGTGTPTLFYEYKGPAGACFLPHDQVQATGHEWSWILWNPETKEFKDLEDEDQDKQVEAA